MKKLLLVAHRRRSSLNKISSWPTGGVSPFDLSRIFLEIYLKEADGWFDIEEKVMREESYNKIP